jgi:alkaline phosphatase D
MYGIWDDHEMINNSGASWPYWDVGHADRAGYPNLVRVAREAFFHYAPLRRVPGDPDRIYRSYSWGPDLELFLLDTRSYRSRNELPDRADAPKTMLGAAQLAWLTEGLARSTATWKVVASGVPLSVPTGGAAAGIIGRDSWADGYETPRSDSTGFERELLDLLGSVDRANVRNLVFISGDVHRALSLRYEVDLDGDGRPLLFHELVAGPLSAGPGSGVPSLDATLRPTMLYGEGDLFNFGYVRIVPQADGSAALLADVRGADGSIRPGSSITLTPGPR